MADSKVTAVTDQEDNEQSYSVPSATAFTNYQRSIYSSLQQPLFSTKPDEWAELARRRLPPGNFGYVYGSAGQCRTYAANISAFDRYRLKPRMLIDVTVRDHSIELFGEKLESPILVGPVGVQSIVHRDAEEATARACRNLDVPMVLSTAATRTIEQVAAANGEGGKRWFQLYWPKPQEEEITASLLKRARENGFTVLVVTLDTFTLGWRPQDLDRAYLPFVWGQGCEIGHSDPVFKQRYRTALAKDTRSIWAKLKEVWYLLRITRNPLLWVKILFNLAVLRKSKAWLDVMNSGVHRDWKDLAILRDLWKGPIVLKGIQTVEDARRAIDHGMDGIIVSNHGGRQLDGAIGSLDALAEIADDSKVKESGITLLFDSGIRTGSDVLKAIALGAKAVLIGRPYMYGLAIAGQAGVEHVLRCIMADTDNALANAGKTSVQEMSREDLSF